MGLCGQKQSNINKTDKEDDRQNLQHMFSQTKQLQERFMKEVYDSQKEQNDLKNFYNIKITQLTLVVRTLVACKEGKECLLIAQQSLKFQKEQSQLQIKTLAFLRQIIKENIIKQLVSITTMQYQNQDLLSLKNLLSKTGQNLLQGLQKLVFAKQGQGLALGKILREILPEYYFFRRCTIINYQSINCGKINVLENHENNTQVFCENLKKNDENSLFIQWLKQQNMENNNIIRIQEIQHSNIEYQIIYDSWDDQQIVANSESHLAIILNQMFEAIQYLHDNDLRYSSLTIDSFRFSSTRKHSILKLTQLRNIYEQPENSMDILKYSSPESVQFSYNREKSRDIWALGVIALELLIGYYPFAKIETRSYRRIVATLLNLTTERIEELISLFHTDIQQLLIGMLKLDQQFRYTINQCKTNIWINFHLNKYISETFSPILNCLQHYCLSAGRIIARFKLVKLLDGQQFARLYELFQEININIKQKISITDIRSFIDSTYQPENIRVEIQDLLYSSPTQSKEWNVFEFIGTGSKFNKDSLERYYHSNIHQQLSLADNINLLHLTAKQRKQNLISQMIK